MKIFVVSWICVANNKANNEIIKRFKLFISKNAQLTLHCIPFRTLTYSKSSSEMILVIQFYSLILKVFFGIGFFNLSYACLASNS